MEYKIISARQGAYARDVLVEFEELWNSPYALEFDKFIDAYSERYIRNKIVHRQREIAKAQTVVPMDAFTLQINAMQIDFIANLQKVRDAGEKRTLLILAIGDGAIIVTSQAKIA